jgi:hypothetical protein
LVACCYFWGAFVGRVERPCSRYGHCADLSGAQRVQCERPFHFQHAGTASIRRADGGTLWEARVETLSDLGQLEKQSCYITKENKVPVFRQDFFDPADVGGSKHNWPRVLGLDFGSETNCLWPDLKGGTLWVVMKSSAAAGATEDVPLYLTTADSVSGQKDA